MTPLLTFDNVSKSFSGAVALDRVNLTIASDTLTVVCGPPECGKSVLLRLLVGLEQPDSGRILLQGEDLTRIPVGRRPIGYVPQSFALYPHMSVFENIAYPLRLNRASKDEVKSSVARVAELLDIQPLLNKTPDQLSGGEKQRTAVARGLLNDAQVFVLDDPLVGLDFKLRERLMEDLRDMRRTLGTSFIYATSDALEALMMADDLAVMDHGGILEHRNVEQLYHEPGHVRSAELIGFPRCNLFDARYDAASGICMADAFRFAIDTDNPGQPPSSLTVALRPEAIRLNKESGTRDDSLIHGDGLVRLVEDLGSECVIYFETGSMRLTTTLRIGEGRMPEDGETIRFAIDPGRMMVFDAARGTRIGRGRRSHGG